MTTLSLPPERLMGPGMRASARGEAVPVRQSHGFVRDRFKDAPCGKQGICTSITPLRRRACTSRPFWRMSPMPNVFTHCWTMFFLMSLSWNTRWVHVLVVWAFWGHSTT